MQILQDENESDGHEPSAEDYQKQREFDEKYASARFLDMQFDDDSDDDDDNYNDDDESDVASNMGDD